jgi:putative tricarboxylic transport membrane protein
VLLRNRDLWAGLVFLLLGVLLIAFLIPVGVVEPKKVKFAVLSPSYYPRIVAIAMSIIGLAIAIGSIRQEPQEDSILTFNLNAAVKVCTVFIILIATAYALPQAGFVLTTTIVLAVMMLLAGERNPIVVGAVSILLPIFLYLFFTKLANVPIPGGILDPYLQRL